MCYHCYDAIEVLDQWNFFGFLNKTTISEALDSINTEKTLQVFSQFMAQPSFLSLCCVS